MKKKIVHSLLIAALLAVGFGGFMTEQAEGAACQVTPNTNCNTAVWQYVICPFQDCYMGDCDYPGHPTGVRCCMRRWGYCWPSPSLHIDETSCLMSGCESTSNKQP